MSYAKRTVVVACDVGAEVGVGHLMRCVAIAEEMQARGARIVFAADVADVPWAAEQLARRGFASAPAFGSAAETIALLDRLGANLVVIDSYRQPPGTYSAVRSSGYPLLAVVDHGVGGRDADLYLDQNIGAERWTPPSGAASRRLAGLHFVVLRDEILAARSSRAEPNVTTERSRPRVLAFFGGTDAAGIAPAAVRALAATEVPLDATVVGASQASRDRIVSVDPAAGQTFTPMPPTSRLATYIADADIVISAAGTSSWELMCLGAATGLTRVADNQRDSYELAVDAGATLGLGGAEDLRALRPATLDALHSLLTDPELRAGLRQSGRRLVDGNGRQRVADACADLIACPAGRRVS